MALKPAPGFFPLAYFILALFAPSYHASGASSYEWYDGEVKRTVILDDTIVAEFPSAETSKEPSKLQRLHRMAAPLRTDQGSGVRLWKVPSDAKGIARSATSESQSHTFSPVLRDGKGSRARMRALPGNMIVFLNPAWTDTRVKKWADGRKLELLKKLELGKNVYQIKSEPGLEALEAANKLHLSGEVVSAQPDWWLEHVKR